MKHHCNNRAVQRVKKKLGGKGMGFLDNCSSSGGNAESPDTNTGSAPYFSGTFNCMMQLYRQGGIKALYAGMDAKLVQTVLTSALTFLTYEQIVSLVTKSYISFLSASSSSAPPSPPAV